VLIVDPSTATLPWGKDLLARVIENRLDLVPALTRRLVELPFGIDHPAWVDDPTFSLREHITRAALPSPGGFAELGAFVGERLPLPFDRHRPLWDIAVVEGLEGGRAAIVARLHHAVTDGLGGSELATLLCDPTSQIIWRDARAPQIDDPIPTNGERMAFALGSAMRRPTRAARLVRSTAGNTRTLLAPGSRTDESAPGLFEAPRHSFNRAVSSRRSIALGSVSLDDVKAVRRGLGGSLNDVAFTLTSAALRTYLERSGETVESRLVALCPVAIRHRERDGRLGNQLGGMLVHLASDLSDPVERLAAQRNHLTVAKRRAVRAGDATLSQLAELLVPGVLGTAARLSSRLRLADTVPPAFNVTVSCFPGPVRPLYAAGARVEAFAPFGPVVDGVGLNITFTTYERSMWVGICGDAATIPDAEPLFGDISMALAELVARVPKV
jgi:diacylglycerol O-acyltransferase